MEESFKVSKARGLLVQHVRYSGFLFQCSQSVLPSAMFWLVPNSLIVRPISIVAYKLVVQYLKERKYIKARETNSTILYLEI